MAMMVETILVTVGALTVIRLLHASGAANLQWMAIPGVLVAAALVPAWLAQREFPRIGLSLDHTSVVAGTLGWVCLCLFPPVFLGLWVMTRLNLPLPLQPVVPPPQGWLAWLLYQFLYVAVAEEIFFRGYVQANTMRWLSRLPALSRGRLSHMPRLAPSGLAIVISAFCFAVAHVVVQGQVISLLTFFPGLILAWLFLRTGSLLAPILLHGLANVSYAVMAMTLAL